MNQALWITRKNYLCGLIKKISEVYGGDDIEFLRQHCKETLELCYGEKIEEMIACYEKILQQSKYYTKRSLNNENYG